VEIGGRPGLAGVDRVNPVRRVTTTAKSPRLKLAAIRICPLIENTSLPSSQRGGDG
jgi:hypothetical protein